MDNSGSLVLAEIDHAEIPPSNHQGAVALVASTCEVIEKAHTAVIEDIDNMITQLTNLKQVLELKKIAAQDKMRDFINSVGHGVSMIKDLEVLIQGIEKRHLQ